MKKGKLGNATAFIRKKKEKWRPSLNGSEDIHEGTQSRGPPNSRSDVSKPYIVYNIINIVYYNSIHIIFFEYNEIMRLCRFHRPQLTIKC